MEKYKRRPVYLPGKEFAAARIPVGSPKGEWFRLHDEAFPALDFSKRPSNRFTPMDGPFNVLYLAQDVETCFLECFGDQIYSALDISQKRWFSRVVSEVTVETMPVCDLNDPEVLSAMKVDLASILCSNLEVPHTWAREIMKHPAAFAGIIYPSRFTNNKCLALFQREEVLNGIRLKDQFNFADTDIAADMIQKFEVRLI